MRLDAESPVALRLAQSPGADKFVGPYERMQVLRARVDALVPRLSDSENIQAKLLQDRPPSDEPLEKHEGRERETTWPRRAFALARIYDSQPGAGWKAPQGNDSNHQ